MRVSKRECHLLQQSKNLLQLQLGFFTVIVKRTVHAFHDVASRFLVAFGFDAVINDIFNLNNIAMQ